MRYSERRDSIKSGDVIAFRRSGFVGNLISAVTRSEWCHIGIAWRVGSRLFLLEAQYPYGVSMRSMSQVGAFAHIATGVDWTDAVEEVAIADLQRPYALLDAIRVGIGLDPSNDGEICSLYAGGILTLAGQPIARRGCTPGAVVSALLDRGLMLEYLQAG